MFVKMKLINIEQQCCLSDTERVQFGNCVASNWKCSPLLTNVNKDLVAEKKSNEPSRRCSVGKRLQPPSVAGDAKGQTEEPLEGR